MNYERFIPAFSLQKPYICRNFSDCGFKLIFEHNSEYWNYPAEVGTPSNK